MPLPNVNVFYKMVAKRYGFWALRSEVCRGNSKGDLLIMLENGMEWTACDQLLAKEI